MAINPISAVGATNIVSPTKMKENSSENTVNGQFENFLKDALENLNNSEKTASSLANDFALGKTDNIHQVVIASEAANIQLQLAMQVRNKVIDAYNEIMRMQV